MSILTTFTLPHTVLQALTTTNPPYTYAVAMGTQNFTLQSGQLISVAVVPPAGASSQLIRLPTPAPQAKDKATISNFSGQLIQDIIAFDMTLAFDPEYPLGATNEVIVGFTFTCPGQFASSPASVLFWPSTTTQVFPSNPSIVITTNENPANTVTGSVSSGFVVANYPSTASASWTTSGSDKREKTVGGFKFTQALSVTITSNPAPTASSGITQVTMTITNNQ